jgi:hypothetical protein
VVTDGGSRRDARGRPSDDAEVVGPAGGTRGGRKPGPLDLPATERKRGDGELVN